MSDSVKTEPVLPSPVALDGTLVARATRLLIAYFISLVLLISAIVAGYVVLREEMGTQRALSEANTHLNVIHRTINESVNLLADFREAARAVPPDNRLTKVIGRRIIRAVEELDVHAEQLTEIMRRLEGTAHWDDFKWIMRTLADDQNAILSRYISQMRELVLRREELGEQKIRPQIPAEAAGARYGALSNDFKEASEQLSEIINRHSIRVEEVHKQLTYLILGMFFLVSLLIVFPLWNRLIKEHRRHELAHQKLHYLAYTDQETGLHNLVGYEQFIFNNALSSATIHTHYLLLIRIQNLDEIYNLIDSQQIREVHRHICKRLNASLFAELKWTRSGESEYATVISQKTVEDAEKWVEPFFRELSRPVNVSGVLVRAVFSIATSQLEELKDKDGGLLREHHANARMVLPKFDRTVLSIPTYDISLTHELAEQNELITAITHGIENREFVPYYQPKFDAMNGRPCSAEVLCR